MLGGASSPAMPAPPPLPDPLPSAPVYASGTNRPRGTANRPGTTGSTIMTSPLGDTATTSTAGKSLLGQ